MIEFWWYPEGWESGTAATERLQNSRHKTPLHKQSIVGGFSEMEQNNKILSTFKVKCKGGFWLNLAASKIWLFMFSHGTPAYSIIGVFNFFIQLYLKNFLLATYVYYWLHYFQ